MREARGRVIINTGDGKGKTTAAMGQAVRAVGAGMKVIMIQFIKGKWKVAEIEGLRHLPGFELRRLGLGFTVSERRIGPLSDHQAAIQTAWEQAVAEVMSDRWDLVILDEINNVLSDPNLNCVVSAADLLKLLSDRPPRLHMVLTGRRAPAELVAVADTVTEMTPVKHAYEAGIQALRGIEF
ncbi:MAG TPA: cob(I)yrinic acid a,c-diamide adenosyltransferase [Symbiobacteriaceae bacterium]|nr:cob(I)yrinic acid a,c-diamide adenosyltransferase [Symbiobacteriaceae bacterium]